MSDFECGEMVEVTIRVRYDDELVSGGKSFFSEENQPVATRLASAVNGLFYLSEKEIVKIEKTENLEPGDVIQDAEGTWYLRTGSGWMSFGDEIVHYDVVAIRRFLRHFRGHDEIFTP